MTARALLLATVFTLTAVSGRAAGVPTRTWTQTGAIKRGRHMGEIQKLRDGRVLLIGGLFEGANYGLPDADLYDPGTGNWVSAPPMRQGRYQFASVGLSDGRVLVAGGVGPPGVRLNSVEIYDPLKNVWTKAAPMAQVRDGLLLVLLPDGRVLAAGGSDGSPVSKLASAEIYDPAANRWSDAGEMSDGRLFAAITVLRDGKVLVAGGSGVSSADLYDPKTNRWIPTGAMSETRFYHRAALLADGRVLVTGGGAGGESNDVTDMAEIYDPKTGRWSRTAPMSVKRHGHAMVVIGKVPLIIGGENRTSDIASTEFYDAAADEWRLGPSLSGGRCYPQAALLDDGRVLVAGGRRGLGGGRELLYAEILSATGSFSQPNAAPVPRHPEVVRIPRPAPPAGIVDGQEDLPDAITPRPRRHAVVIGIERYRETLPRADYAASDARLASEYFRRVLGVPEENLALLSDDRATKSDFEKYFERWLPNRVEPGDEVYVYFSGHGAPNPKTGESYLVPFDADPTYIEQTGYPIKRLYAQLARLKAKRVLVAMDSCFSGAGGHSVIAKGARPLVTVASSDIPAPLIVLSASGGDQISNTYEAKRHGLFTYFFLKGLKDNDPDFRVAYDYLKPQVSRIARREYNSDQDPQWRKGK